MSTATLYNYMKTVKCRRISKRVAKRYDHGEKEKAINESFPMGNFRFLPGEVRYKIFDFLPLSDLGNVALTSRTLRNTVMCYLHDKQALLVIVPEVVSERCLAQDSSVSDHQRDKCLKHFHDLGILMKRSTCLYPTKERLREVGVLLDKLKDTHTEICMCLGSDTAYSCYGEFLHAFVAGWEDDEKFRAYLAIKGASCLDNRTKEVLNSLPGSQPWYERYIRVFCRQVFLDKSADNAEKGFWLYKILQPWPLVFQARLLYTLYGPLNENGMVDWNIMTTCPTFYGVEDVALREVAENLQVLHQFVDGWTDDDLISVFDEMIAFPNDWCLENVAKLLKLSGHSIAVEILGSKAVNGRIHELAYIGYYLVQALGQESLSQGRGKQLVEFTNLLQKVMSNMANYKEKSIFITSFFNVWEENILSFGEEMQRDTGDTPEEQEQVFSGSIHNLTQFAGILLKNHVK